MVFKDPRLNLFVFVQNPDSGPQLRPAAAAALTVANAAQSCYLLCCSSSPSHDWQVTTRSTAEAFAANGFELPDDELIRLIGDSGYLTATLQRA